MFSTLNMYDKKPTMKFHKSFMIIYELGDVFSLKFQPLKTTTLTRFVFNVKKSFISKAQVVFVVMLCIMYKCICTCIYNNLCHILDHI